MYVRVHLAQGSQLLVCCFLYSPSAAVVCFLQVQAQLLGQTPYVVLQCSLPCQPILHYAPVGATEEKGSVLVSQSISRPAIIICALLAHSLAPPH